MAPKSKRFDGSHDEVAAVFALYADLPEFVIYNEDSKVEVPNWEMSVLPPCINA